MTNPVWRGAFGDAWRCFRRDRQLLLPLAGVFLFLPQFAFYLLATPLPSIPADTTDAATLLAPGSPLVVWMEANAPWMLLTVLLMAFGGLAVITLYLSGERLTLGEALRRAPALFPRYLLAAIIAGIPAAPVQLGLLILALPCLYVIGRLMLVGPALVAERPLPVARAIARSVALTKRRGLLMLAFAALALFAAMIAPAPFRLLRDSLVSAGEGNPVTLALLEALGSGLAAAVALATVLVEIALYRRLAAASSGI